jgi:hypothetical protein
MDNLSVKWNGDGGHKTSGARHATLAQHGMHHVAPHVAASFSPLSAHDGQDTAAQSGSHTGSAHDAPYHTQLFALPGHDAGGLTGQFALPQAEHFGT